MKNIVNKKLITAYLLGFLLLPGVSLAVWDGNVKSVMDNVVNIVETLFGAAVTIYFIWYVIMFLSAKGDATKLQKARQGLLWGLVGVIIGGVALTIVNVVTSTFGL